MRAGVHCRHRYCGRDRHDHSAAARAAGLEYDGQHADRALRRHAATPKRGDLFVIAAAARHGSLGRIPGHAVYPIRPVLKPIAALAGDLVCRSGAAVTINGRFAAIARRARSAWPHPADLARMPAAVSDLKSSSSPAIQTASTAATTGRCRRALCARRCASPGDPSILTLQSAHPSPGQPLRVV